MDTNSTDKVSFETQKIDMREQISSIISTSADENNISLFEAATLFMEENDIDAVDFMEMADDYLKERLRQSAVDERMVRKPYRHQSLEFEEY